ncbi:paraquat-inducible protein A [Kaarinaea lacus]
MHQHITACHECDLIVEVPALPVNANALCPRCGYKLARNKKDSISRTFALSLTALILFLPAMTLPMLSLNLVGQEIIGTVFSSIKVLYNDKYYLVAFLSLLCAVVVPLISIIVMLFITAGYRNAFLRDTVKSSLKFYSHLQPWSMIDVYMVGIITSIYKLVSMADIKFGIGLLCFTGLFLAVLTANLTFNTEEIWEYLDEHNDGHEHE